MSTFQYMLRYSQIYLQQPLITLIILIFFKGYYHNIKREATGTALPTPSYLLFSLTFSHSQDLALEQSLLYPVTQTLEGFCCCFFKINFTENINPTIRMLLKLGS